MYFLIPHNPQQFFQTHSRNKKVRIYLFQEHKLMTETYSLNLEIIKTAPPIPYVKTFLTLILFFLIKSLKARATPLFSFPL